jgi:hypothetical protein
MCHGPKHLEQNVASRIERHCCPNQTDILTLLEKRAVVSKNNNNNNKVITYNLISKFSVL